MDSSSLPSYTYTGMTNVSVVGVPLLLSYRLSYDPDNSGTLTTLTFVIPGTYR